MAGLYQLHGRRPRIFKVRKVLADVSDEEVVSRYRLTKPAIQHLVDLFEDGLQRNTDRSQAIPVETQVLVGLRYLAKGDFLSEVADLHGISRSSACNIIGDFVEAVNAKVDNIRFPAGNELNVIKHKFFTKSGIPNTVGAVDCTLIPIQAPTVHEEAYVCRKNFHALNVQAVVDHRTKFIDVVAKWPGSTHDASIFDNCRLKTHLENSQLGHLLGDGGYPLRRYLLTPVLGPNTAAERAYNNAQSQGRMVVERAFGLLKSRFRCLHKTGGCLAMKPDKCCQAIVACMRLHNLCLELGVPAPADLLVAGQDGGAVHNFGQEARAVAYRDNIIQLF